MKRIKVIGNQHDRESILATPSEPDYSRYPFRLPDWLWTDARRSCCLDQNHRHDIQYKLQMVEALSTLSNSTAGDALEWETNLQLGRQFAIRDLTADAEVFTSNLTGLTVCAQIDPTFDAEAQRTIRSAIPLFLDHALDDDVVCDAIRQSIPKPEPQPNMYVTEPDGTPKLDDLGHPTYTDAYALFLRTYQLPDGEKFFNAQIRASLLPGQHNLLVLSRYSGNVWWGRSWYYFFYLQEQQLGYVAPTRGFVYIALNSDKLASGSPSFDEPAFWASKLSHEWLHNLGYWHPGYADPAERDANNKPGSMAFIVAYEFSLLAKLRRLCGSAVT